MQPSTQLDQRRVSHEPRGSLEALWGRGTCMLDRKSAGALRTQLELLVCTCSDHFQLGESHCMLLTVCYHDKSALMTIGDAMQSFLNHPDQYTRGFCMQSEDQLRLSMRPKDDARVIKQLSSRYDVMWSSSWDPMCLDLIRRAYLNKNK